MDLAWFCYACETIVRRGFFPINLKDPGPVFVLEHSSVPAKSPRHKGFHKVGGTCKVTFYDPNE